MEQENSKRQKTLEMLCEAKDLLQAWKAGNISHGKMQETLQQINYQDMVDEGLCRDFDELSQVGCAIEILESTPLGGDDVSIVRSYVLASWLNHSHREDQQKEPPVIDPLGLLAAEIY